MEIVVDSSVLVALLDSQDAMMSSILSHCSIVEELPSFSGWGSGRPITISR